jgi:tyrosyl-tRNA synthetase
MALLDELSARGLLAEVTDRAGLADLLASPPVAVYAGYDPTSTSLHVGNLVPTILLKRFQLAGHRPIVVVGGATGMIGDPSGKSDERNLLDEATLAANVVGIRNQLAKLLDFDDPKTGAVMTNNFDWTRDVSYLTFLRDYGKHLTINYMTAKDSVNSRLESENGISYTEFSYMLLQAFDFVQLLRSHRCRLQVGGSDQWGNITAGCELARKLGEDQLYGLVAPLLLDASGQKMGKTASGERVWLDAARTSPFDFYKYWFNISDSDAVGMLKKFSLRPLDEIAELLAEHDLDRSKRLAQRELARAMTSWVHGAAAIAGIEAANRVMFGGDLAGLTDADLAQLAGTIPTLDVPYSELAAGIPIVDLLARTVTNSKGAARRLVEQGGAYVNNRKVSGIDHRVTLQDLATESMIVLRSGKKEHHFVRVVR